MSSCRPSSTAGASGDGGGEGGGRCGGSVGGGSIAPKACGLGEERRGVNVKAARSSEIAASWCAADAALAACPAAQLTPAILLQVASRRVGVAVARGSICGAVHFASDVSMLPVLIGGAFLVGAFIGAWWYRRRRTINISDSYGPMLG